MRTAAALLVLVLLLFLNPAVVAAAPPAARMDLAVLLWESAGAVPFAAGCCWARATAAFLRTGR